jgi:hypothetical protein
MSEIGISPVFQPDGKKIFYISPDNSTLYSINTNGTGRQEVKKGFFEHLVKLSISGRYLLYMGGETTAISPGYESATLEMLDLAKMKTDRVYKGSLIHGTSWVE